MDWHKRSTVEGMKTLLEGLYVPDRSSSLLISRNRVLEPENDIYSDFFFKLFPQTSGGVFTIIDGEKRLVIALREAISEMSLPGYVRVEAIDDNSWNLGRLHGMRRVRYEMTVSERCLIAFVKFISFFVRAGIWVYINPHYFVAVLVLAIAALTQEIVLFATVMTVVVPPVIRENKNWRLLQKRRLTSWVETRKGWPESEPDYQQKLRDISNDPDRWKFTRAIIQSEISQRLVGSLVNRYYKWNESRRPSIRLALMSNGNVSPSP